MRDFAWHLLQAEGMLEAGKTTTASISESLERGDPRPPPEIVSALSQFAAAAIQAGELHLQIARFKYDLGED